MLSLSVSPQREGGGSDGDEDRVTHPGGVAGGHQPLVEGAGTGVPIVPATHTVISIPEHQAPHL